MKKTKKCHIVVVVLFIAMNILPVSVYSEEINTDNNIKNTASTGTASTDTAEKIEDSKNLKINSNKDQSKTNEFITDSSLTGISSDINSGDYWYTLTNNQIRTTPNEPGSFVIAGLDPNADYSDETFVVPSRITYGVDSDRHVLLDKGFFDHFKEFIKNHPQIKKVKFGTDDGWVDMYHRSTNNNGVYSIPTSLDNMFSDLPQLTSIDLSRMILGNGNGYSANEMFAGCTNLTEVKFATSGFLFPTYKIKEFRKMFAYCENLTFIDLQKVNFSDVKDAANMFYTKKPTPLLIKSDNDWLKAKYNKYIVDNRTVGGPMFLANGGQFNDGQIFKRYFNKIVISPTDVSLSDFNSYKDNLAKEIKNNNDNFLNWKITSGKAPSTNDDLFQTIIYTAQWGAMLGNIPSEKDNIKQEVNSDLGIAYFPRAFSFPKTELSNNEDKQIIKISEDANYHIAVLNKNSQHWMLQAKLVWNTDDLKGNSYIQTSNPTGNIYKNTNNGASKFLDSDLKLVTSKNSIGSHNQRIATDNYSLIMNVENSSDDIGVFDYDLGQLSLVLENPSKISEGKYTGNITWDLSIVP